MIGIDGNTNICTMMDRSVSLDILNQTYGDKSYFWAYTVSGDRVRTPIHIKGIHKLSIEDKNLSNVQYYKVFLSNGYRVVCSSDTEFSVNYLKNFKKVSDLIPGEALGMEEDCLNVGNEDTEDLDNRKYITVDSVDKVSVYNLIAVNGRVDENTEIYTIYSIDLPTVTQDAYRDKDTGEIINKNIDSRYLENRNIETVSDIKMTVPIEIADGVFIR